MTTGVTAADCRLEDFRTVVEQPLQIGSAFGRAMETVDRAAMCEALYPVLHDRAARRRS